jgi:ferredoxin
MPVQIAPSVLAADFANLQKEVEMLNASEADYIHVDIMDGVFVPNISFGIPVTEAIKKHATKPLDVHLMIAPVDPYITAFAEAGRCLNCDVQTVFLKDKCIECDACVDICPRGLYSIHPVSHRLWVACTSKAKGDAAAAEAQAAKVAKQLEEIDTREQGLSTMLDPLKFEEARGRGEVWSRPLFAPFSGTLACHTLNPPPPTTTPTTTPARCSPACSRAPVMSFRGFLVRCAARSVSLTRRCRRRCSSPCTRTSRF